MQIVIDIDNVDYEYIKNGCIIPVKIDNHIYDAIRNGTPLNDVLGEIIKELDKALYEHFHEEDSPLNTTEVRLGAVRNFIKNFQLVNSQNK